jgi:hypothetical protein
MISIRVFSKSIFRFRNTREATPSPSRNKPSRMCSVPTYAWLSARASLPASASTFFTRGVNGRLPTVFVSGPTPTAFSTSRRTASKLTPIR